MYIYIHTHTQSGKHVDQKIDISPIESQQHWGRRVIKIWPTATQNVLCRFQEQLLNISQLSIIPTESCINYRWPGSFQNLSQIRYEKIFCVRNSNSARLMSKLTHTQTPLGCLLDAYKMLRLYTSNRSYENYILNIIHLMLFTTGLVKKQILIYFIVSFYRNRRFKSC